MEVSLGNSIWTWVFPRLSIPAIPPAASGVVGTVSKVNAIALSNFSKILQAFLSLTSRLVG